MSQHDAAGVIMEEPTPSGPKPAPKSRAVWIAVAVIVVIVVVVLAAVLGGVFAPPAQPALRIATLLSLTGGLSLFGPGDTKGANLAVEEINAAGGVLGQPITIFNEDDQTNPTAAAAAATKLITQNHVNAIVGAQFSGGSLAATKTAGDNGVVMVAPSATSVLWSDLTVTKQWQAGLLTHPGWNRQWVFSGGLQDQVFVDQPHDTSVGVDVTELWGTAPAAPVSSLYNDFVTRYKARYFNQAPQLYASHTY